jgi:hypothetical protein
MIKNRRIAPIVLTIGILMTTICIDRTPSQAINLKRTTETENDFILQQLQLLKQNSRSTSKLLEDVDVVRLAFGSPKANNVAASVEYQFISLDQSQYQYQYQTDLRTEQVTPEAGQVWNNLIGTFAQLDFDRTSSTRSQIQILTQSSFEDVDKNVYYDDVRLVERATEQKNLVSTVLNPSSVKFISVSNSLQAIKRNNPVSQVLGDNPGATLSFFSGIQKLKEGSVSLEAENIGLGNIKSVIANSISNKIERSKYQLDLEEQNQQFIEDREQRREDLQEQLERDKEKRDKERKQVEEQRQEELNDAQEKREEQIEKLQQTRKKFQSSRPRQLQSFVRNR